MKPFTRKAEGDPGRGRPPSDRLQAFTEALWKAFVPSDGSCSALQGELIRAHGRLQDELIRDGMEKHFQRDDAETALGQTYLGGLLLFLLDTLIANRNGALSASDARYFAEARRDLEPQWLRVTRQHELESKAGEQRLTKAEKTELARLEETRGGPDLAVLIGRAQRCVANFCLANMALVDMNGPPVVERGLADVLHVFEPPAAPPPCPRRNGRGWLPAATPGDFPSFCSYKKPRALAGEGVADKFGRSVTASARLSQRAGD